MEPKIVKVEIVGGNTGPVETGESTWVCGGGDC